MPATSSIISSSVTSDIAFAGGGRVRPLIVRRMPQARRMRLSVDPRDGAVRLLLPKRAGLRAALSWVEGQRGWVEQALAALPEARPIVAGGTVPFAGEPLLVEWCASHPRAVRLEEGRLLIGGPVESVQPRLLRWMRAQALATLDAESRAMAERAGVSITKVAVGDPRGRWGSCSTSGDLRYSWRLILAPPEVREATVAHEVAHRLHMDHSAAFHAAAERLLGRDGKAERAWLRAHGAALHWVGRDS